MEKGFDDDFTPLELDVVVEDEDKDDEDKLLLPAEDDEDETGALMMKAAAEDEEDGGHGKGLRRVGLSPEKGNRRWNCSLQRKISSHTTAAERHVALSARTSLAVEYGSISRATIA